MMEKAINADKEFIEAYLIVGDVYIELKDKQKPKRRERKKKGAINYAVITVIFFILLILAFVGIAIDQIIRIKKARKKQAS